MVCKCGCGNKLIPRWNSKLNKYTEYIHGHNLKCIPMEEVKLTCLTCKKEFKSKDYKVKYKRKFCSHKCYGESLKGRDMSWCKTGKNVNCIVCGKSVYRCNAHLQKQPKIYCSKECSPLTRRTCSDETILKAFTKEKLTLKEIYKKYHGHQIPVNKILKENGITKEDIRCRANKRIGANTKKHRKYQKFPSKDTSIELKIQNFLKKLRIEFFTHQHMNIKHSYQCDIFIPSINLVIECDGDYWHKYPTGRDIDHIRTSELLKKGFKVLRLWEFEIREMGLYDFELRLKQKSI